MATNSRNYANAMGLDSIALWDDFVESFRNEIVKTPSGHLQWAWSSIRNRTTFYQNCILPKVAAHMSLIARYELFRVDASFCIPPATRSLIPIIHVESENNASSASHEVAKLCALVGPLKVLITCQKWTSLGGGSGSEKRLLAKWRKIICSHQSHYPNNGEIGLIVGEYSDKDKHLRFYSTLLSGQARAQPIFAKNMADVPIQVPTCPDAKARWKHDVQAELTAEKVLTLREAALKETCSPRSRAPAARHRC